MFTPTFGFCHCGKNLSLQECCSKALLSHLHKMLDNGEAWLQKKNQILIGSYSQLIQIIP